MALALESTGARMSRLGSCLLNELPILSVGELIERIDSVDIAALRELSGDLFGAGRLSVVGVGPDEQTFRAAIEPLEGAGEAARNDREGTSQRLAAEAAG
jgi:hypothetical protein